MDYQQLGKNALGYLAFGTAALFLGDSIGAFDVDSLGSATRISASLALCHTALENYSNNILDGDVGLKRGIKKFNAYHLEEKLLVGASIYVPIVAGGPLYHGLKQLLE